MRKERGTTMRPWLIMLGPGLALVGLQAVQAQVTIDITKITCDQFLAGQLTDASTLSKWLNGYLNGERHKTLVDPLSLQVSDLITYCITHTDMPVLDAARNLVGADK
jgi:acid stress chaperone HdeB